MFSVHRFLRWNMFVSFRSVVRLRRSFLNRKVHYPKKRNVGVRRGIARRQVSHISMAVVTHSLTHSLNQSINVSSAKSLKENIHRYMYREIKREWRGEEKEDESLERGIERSIEVISRRVEDEMRPRNINRQVHISMCYLSQTHAGGHREIAPVLGSTTMVGEELRGWEGVWQNNLECQMHRERQRDTEADETERQTNEMKWMVEQTGHWRGNRCYQYLLSAISNQRCQYLWGFVVEEFAGFCSFFLSFFLLFRKR